MSAIHGESSQEWGLYIRAEFHSSKLDWFLICLLGFFVKQSPFFPKLPWECLSRIYPLSCLSVISSFTTDWTLRKGNSALINERGTRSFLFSFLRKFTVHDVHVAFLNKALFLQLNSYSLNLIINTHDKSELAFVLKVNN